MTSQKQIEANRRNTLLSTGPRTEEGKKISRANAYRHGLTAETVIIGLEDAAEYYDFEAEIVSEYEPESVIERELTRRMASLLWRLRRSTLIETGLLRGQLERAPRRGGKSDVIPQANGAAVDTIIRWAGLSTLSQPRDSPNEDRSDANQNGRYESGSTGCETPERCPRNKQQAITRGFLNLTDLPSAPLERIGRYEAALWRQFVQTLFALDEAKRHRLVTSRRHFTPYPPQW